MYLILCSATHVTLLILFRGLLFLCKHLFKQRYINIIVFIFTFIFIHNCFFLFAFKSGRTIIQKVGDVTRLQKLFPEIGLHGGNSTYLNSVKLKINLYQTQESKIQKYKEELWRTLHANIDLIPLLLPTGILSPKILFSLQRYEYTHNSFVLFHCSFCKRRPRKLFPNMTIAFPRQFWTYFQK